MQSAREAPDTHTDVLYVDLAEGMAGRATATELAPEFDLKATVPADIRYGWDLKTPDGRRRWKDMIRTERPLLVMVGFKCTNWCAFNTRFNYHDRPEVLQEKQESDRPMLRLMVWTMHQQIKNHRFFLFENPSGSAIWKEDVLKRILEHPKTMVGDGHGCPYGLKGEKGGLLWKHWRWMTNHPLLLQAVTWKCPNTKGHKYHDHEKIEGNNTARSGEYPEKLCRQILAALREIADVRDSYRFNDLPKSRGFVWSVNATTLWQPPGEHYSAFDVFFLDVNKDTVAWTESLRLAADMLENRRGIPNFDLETREPLWKKVTDLVPWEVTRIQISRAPKTRRMPFGGEYTHRACALILNDDTIRIESEAAHTALPRAKFAVQYDKPVRHAIFVFGYAPEQNEADHNDGGDLSGVGPEHSLKYGNGDITFVGLNKYNAPADIRSVVARLHMHFGHPSNKELTRFCASQGASTTTLAVISALRCEACERNKAPSVPRPVSLPKAGQFNDKVFTDIVYFYDIRGESHMCIGVIDRSTWLHKHRRITVREPQVAYDALEVTWLAPYGLPLLLVCDEDGCFKGEFQENLETLGVAMRYAPPGAHHQMGFIESNNYFWRNILHRIVDSRAIYDVKQIDLAFISADHAVNSHLKRCGRSPDQATFGRAPRLPSELLSDEANALAYENVTSASESLRLADHYRLDAIRAFFEEEQKIALQIGMSAKTAVRKEGFTGGEKVGYWRAQGPKRPGGKKARRAGYLIGTFAGYQLDEKNPQQLGNNAWIMSNSQLKQVSREQLRHAQGFENWTPRPEDVKALKDFERLFNAGAYEDAREDGPNADEQVEPEVQVDLDIPPGPVIEVPPPEVPLDIALPPVPEHQELKVYLRLLRCGPTGGQSLPLVDFHRDHHLVYRRHRLCHRGRHLLWWT